MFIGYYHIVLFILLCMKQFVEKSYKEKKQMVQSQIERIDIRIKALLEEPRSVVSHILNSLYDEKDQLLSKLGEIESVLSSLDKMDDQSEFKEINVKVNGSKKKFYLVHDSYVDPRNGFISHSSPIGMAIKDKKPGDKFQISTPIGFMQYQLLG